MDHQNLELSKVKDIAINAATSENGRALNDLFNENHEIYGIRIHENLAHHNHTPHLLGSAYLLGANKQQLKELFDDISSNTTKWTPSPGEITSENFKSHLGDATYQRPFVEYFGQESEGLDWKETIEKFLFGGPEPLIHSLMAGLTHPMIHLAYAIEFQSKVLALEALGLAATCHDFMHKYLVDKPPATMKYEPLETLHKIRDDSRFDDAKAPTIDTLKPLFDVAEGPFLEYWTSWVPDMHQLELAQRLSVAVLAAPDQNDFVLCHALTSFHALRVVLPTIPKDQRVDLVRQWWLYIIAAYVLQGRPEIQINRIENVELLGKDWSWVQDQVLTGQWRLEAHFVKAIRAFKNAGETWGDKDQYYLKAAVRFAEKFNGWTGFGDAYPSFVRHQVNSNGKTR